MAGGLRRRFKPYGLESGPSWPLSSMPFSVTKTSEDTHSCSLPGLQDENVQSLEADLPKGLPLASVG